MGRVIRREVVAIRCELRSCGASKRLTPLSLYADWTLQQEQLQEAVDQGWVLVLTPQLRSYCPRHAARAQTCSCRTNRERQHLCMVHSAEVSRLLWATGSPTPDGDLGVFWVDDAVAA